MGSDLSPSFSEVLDMMKLVDTSGFKKPNGFADALKPGILIEERNQTAL